MRPNDGEEMDTERQIIAIPFNGLQNNNWINYGSNWNNLSHLFVRMLFFFHI